MNPSWLDRDEYPYQSRFVDVDGGRMHYVDEGAGRPVVMVHGASTWSFLYRHLLRGLRTRHRCVAPDHLGSGLSARPTDWSYRPEDQARNLAALVEGLGLEDITLVVHDLGGPIGLAYALARPDNVRQLVLFNTWMWPLDDEPRLVWQGRCLRSRVGRRLCERWALPARAWPGRLAGRSCVTPAVRRHYLAPLDDPVARHAGWVSAREVLGSSDWYARLWQARAGIAGIPALLLWGQRDPVLGRFLSRWLTVFEHADVVTLPEVGHAPPEERGPELVPFLLRFLDKAESQASSGSTPTPC